MKENENKKRNLTILLSGGRLPQAILHKVDELSKKYSLGVYLSTMQNLRLIDINEKDFENIKNELAQLGADFKVPGRFPQPKVCIGKPYCKLGLVMPDNLSQRIWDQYKERTDIKPKFKIAIAACPASCSNALIADIGIVATKKGYDIYAGGKGGTRPAVGQRIMRGADEDEVLDVIEKLVNFHDRKTGSKQRMRKLINDPEFPFLSQ